jgi:hypothetical protein
LLYGKQKIKRERKEKRNGGGGVAMILSKMSMVCTGIISVW